MMMPRDREAFLNPASPERVDVLCMRTRQLANSSCQPCFVHLTTASFVRGRLVNLLKGL